MKSHREMYPSQYNHPLCGKRVRFNGEFLGTVERVVDTAFGDLAIMAEIGAEKAWAVRDLTVEGEEESEPAPPNPFPSLNPFGYPVDYPALIAAVRKHALEHYEAGWDVIVEAFEDQEIVDAIGGARTPEGAIKKLAVIVEAHIEELREICNA